MSDRPVVVKVCGITTIADAEACIAAGVDWLGLNFVPSSKRKVGIAEAKTIATAVRGRAEVVGVVADLTLAELRELQREVGLDRLQLHGDEAPELVRAVGKSAFKALRVGCAVDVARAADFEGLLLVDAKVEGALGGTGHRVDLALARELASTRQILLAGGLVPENVADAVRMVQPWGVDVASGVERAPGVKDLDAVSAFVAEARRGAKPLQAGDRRR